MRNFKVLPLLDTEDQCSHLHHLTKYHGHCCSKEYSTAASNAHALGCRGVGSSHGARGYV